MRNPVEDLPSCESECCDVGGCASPWAWSPEGVTNGPRSLRLCEEHSDEWLRSERDLLAEREEMAGREGVLLRPRPLSYAPLFGLVRDLEAIWRARRSA